MPKKNPYRAKALPDSSVVGTAWVASLFGLTQQTISDMARRGEIPAFRPRPRAQWKFDREKIIAHKEQSLSN